MYIKPGNYTISINGSSYRTIFFNSEDEYDKYVEELHIHNSESYLRVEAQYNN